MWVIRVNISCCGFLFFSDEKEYVRGAAVTSVVPLIIVEA